MTVLPEVILAGQPGHLAHHQFLHDFYNRISTTLPVFLSDPDIGGVGDNATDNTVAIQNAVDALPAQGGTIWCGDDAGGQYRFSGTIDVADRRSIVFAGPGAPTAGAAQASALIYTGTDPRALDCRSTSGVGFRGVEVTYTNAAFTGALIDYSHSAAATDSAFGFIEDCLVAGVNAAGQTARLVDWDKAIFCEAYRTNFFGAGTGIRGKNGASYSNANRIRSCEFQAQAVMPIVDPGDTTWIVSNAFEALRNGNAAAVSCSTTAVGLSILGNFCGDANSSGTWFSLIAEGGVFMGNSVSFGATGLNLASTIGFDVLGNRFYTLTNGITYDRANFQNGRIGGNQYNSVTNKIVGTGTRAAAGPIFISENTIEDFMRHYGIIELAGGTGAPDTSSTLLAIAGVQSTTRGVAAFGDGSGFNFQFRVRAGSRAGIPTVQIDDTEGSGLTALWVEVNDGVVARNLRQINVGALNSAGVGFRQLSVTNT